MIAVIHLSESSEVIRQYYQPEPPPRPGSTDCAFNLDVDPFPVYWLIAKNVFLAAAPSLALLGRLRQALAR
jgi:hypothetical protein